MHQIRKLSRRCGPLAVLGLVLLCGFGGAQTRAAGTAAAPVTRVRFQLRAECTCAPCCFALQSQLRKLPGVTRVDLSTRERVVTVAFDESRTPLARVAAAVGATTLGKDSALIGDFTDARSAPEAASLAHIAGVRSAEVETPKHRVLLELADNGSLTTAALTAALAKAGVAVSFDRSH